MEKMYYVEVSVSGCIAVSGKDIKSEDDAQKMVKAAISGSSPDPEIMESIGDMLRQKLDSNDADVGDAFCHEE